MFVLLFNKRRNFLFVMIEKNFLEINKETATVPGTAETGEGIPQLMGRMLQYFFCVSRKKFADFGKFSVIPVI